ncbi:MAG: hypothetical protein ACE5JN_08375 [Candidatus Methylomirabilia bacterium]
MFEPKAAADFVFKDLLYEKKEWVARITLNRPQVFSEFRWGPYAKSCEGCGATYLPEEFAFCGRCGERLVSVEAEEGGGEQRAGTGRKGERP